MALAAGTRLGAYEITGTLGAGGMGEVYRATDTNLKREVAIKILPPAFANDADRIARFQREAEALAALNHPNIAQIYGLERSGETTALALELVEGPTLADRIAEGPVPTDEALHIAMQIADALEAAHEQNIVHRDLKPANVKLRPDGTVKVLDFGIATAPESPIATSGRRSPTLLTPALTEAGVLLGTAAYMSPEQARGRSVDQRADIWAFGCVLYEMLTGQPAFGGEDVTTTLARVLEREADAGLLPAGVSPDVSRTTELCLQKDVKERLADIRDVKLALKGAFDSGPQRVGPEAAVSLRAAERKSRSWMAVAAVSLIIAGTVAWVQFGETRQPERPLRYTIPLPKNGNAEGLYFQYSLSPDGHYVTASGVVGQKSGIFVRALDSLEWQFLPGTESSDLFWSADSRSIGFFEGRRLKSIAVAGGPVEDIADIGPGGFFNASGSWSPDGIIVFAPPAEGGLMSVAATGGEARPLTIAEPGVNHAYPAFLPDGRHFVYTATGGASPGIYLASLDDPTGRRLLADVSPAFFAPSASKRGEGYLIFVRNGRLMAQPFDARALELGGEASSIAERGLLGDNGALAAAISDDGILAYQSGGNRQYDSRLAWFDRSGHEVSALGSSGPPAAVALSPDETTVAITRPGGPAADTGNVWLRDMERGLENPFTHGDEVPSNSNTVWSPDGSRVAYASLSSGTERVYIADVSGSQAPRPVLESGNRKIVTDWSGDGYLVYTELDPQTGADLKYLRLDGEGATEPVVFRGDNFDTSFGTLSPDGRWIAYVSNETGRYEVWVQAFPSGAGKWRISGGESGAAEDSQQPRWSRDGRELFFDAVAGAKQTMMSAPVETPARPGASPVGEPKALFEVRSNGFAPFQGTYLYDVSRDGQRFLIDVFDEKSEPTLNIVVNWERALHESR